MSVNNWRRRDWDSVRIIIWLLDSQSRMQQAPQQCANGVTWFAFQKGTTRENRERRDPWPLALFLLYPFHGNKTAEHTAHDDYSLMHLHAATGDIPTTKNETRSEKREARKNESLGVLTQSVECCALARSLVRCCKVCGSSRRFGYYFLWSSSAHVEGGRKKETLKQTWLEWAAVEC